MITNCSKCGKAMVIPRASYSPNKKNVCKKCEDNGLMRKIVTSIKGVFSPKPTVNNGPKISYSRA